MEQFRTDRHNGRTIYIQRGALPGEHDEPIGMLDTPELATFAVAAMNAATMLVAALPGGQRPATAPPSPLPIEAPEPGKLQCAGCLRWISVRRGGASVAPHKDKPHGGKPCNGQPATKDRRTYRRQPDNLLELLAQHNGSAAEVAQILDVPRVAVQSWKNRVMQQQHRRERLAALPLHDPEDLVTPGAA